MSAQPEALRLADDLDAGWCSLRLVLEPAAAELRRLHAANLDCIAWYEAAKAQRDELLATLKDMVAGDAEAIAEAKALGVPFPEEMLTAYRRAVAVIAKAEAQ